MKRRPVQKVEQQKIHLVNLEGGEDQMNSALNIKDGALIFSRNYEPTVNIGYQRAGNFERFDGRAKPSDATYWTLEYDAGTAAFVEGETITGGVSGATGVFSHIKRLAFDVGTERFEVNDLVTGDISGATGYVAWVELTSGSWRPQDAAGYLYLHTVTGTFADNELINSTYGSALVNGAIEDLTLSSGTFVGNDAAGTLYLRGVTGDFQDNETLTGGVAGSATSNGVSAEDGAANDELAGSGLMTAIWKTRDAIQVVPGSGPVRGIAGLDGTIYAFRNNVGGTALDIYRATASGWSQISMPSYIEYDAGTSDFAEGLTLTGGTSGATATIDAHIIVSGSTGSSTRVGRLYLSSVSGTFQDNETITDSNTGSATANGTLTAVSLSPGGNVETIVENFSGNPADRKIYGVDGVNPAFELSGTTFLQIPSANASDTPNHIAAHRGYLFLSFDYSIQHSGTFGPRDLSAISGAVEIATGDTVTGFAKLSGDILAMFNRSATYLLYGESPSNWERREHNANSGAIARSVQTIGTMPTYLDDPGLQTLRSTEQFGDFKEGTISKMVEDYLTSKKGLVSASMQVKEKNQYRIFFSDGEGMHVRIDRKQPSFTRVQYGKVVRTTLRTEDSDGNEILFFGSDDGYVYQSDIGRSADGVPIEGYLRLPYWNIGSPRQYKRFLQAILNIEASGGTALEFTAEYDYGSATKPRDKTLDFDIQSGGGSWNISTWGNFVWGAQSVGEAIGYLGGSGKNISLLIRTFSAAELPHVIESVIMHYLPRGLLR